MSNSNKTQVSADLQSKYDGFYSEDREDAWRKLGAKYKVENIIEVVGNQ